MNKIQLSIEEKIHMYQKVKDSIKEDLSGTHFICRQIRSRYLYMPSKLGPMAENNEIFRVFPELWENRPKHIGRFLLQKHGGWFKENKYNEPINNQIYNNKNRIAFLDKLITLLETQQPKS